MNASEPHRAARVKPPAQARSRATERRILEAAAEIVEAEGLASLSVAKVVRRARSSVGSFYARFDDKDALLQAVHRARLAPLVARLEDMERAKATAGIPGEQLITLFAREIVEHYEAHPRLMAAFYARSAAEPILWRATVEAHLALAGCIVRLLASAQWASPRSDLEDALAMAIHVVFAFLGQWSVHRDAVSDAIPFRGEALIDEVTQMVGRYVGAPGAPVPSGAERAS